jgi:ferredoxin
MKTGPAVTFGFDLALTELGDRLVIEVGTDAGGAALAKAPWVPCTLEEIEKARELPFKLSQHMMQRDRASGAEASEGQPKGRYLDTREIHDLLLHNLEHPRWDHVAERCLACGNCTMVCPTCFCSSVQEVTDLTGDTFRRERLWDSCFSAEHSYLTAGPVRRTTRSRYRQWLTHKLATWIDQFGASGCVGCGRCITWCPVGIDLTEEVEALRRDRP